MRKSIIMYRGYSISKREIECYFNVFERNSNFYVPYEKFLNESVNKNLSKFREMVEGKVLDAEIIQKDWFPEINAHVFISHSHADIFLAKRFAGWLYQRFGIVSFIDSCVWGYADDLLKKLDDKYCKKLYNSHNYDQNNLNFYDYDLRNSSTAHVHMMLMTALNKMIDKTECVFFINTPNSNIGNGGNPITKSPWIYGEIETSRLIKKKYPERDGIEYKKGGEILFEGKKIDMIYPLDMGHFYSLNSVHLLKWKGNMIKFDSNKKPLRALDELYNITPKKTII